MNLRNVTMIRGMKARRDSRILNTITNIIYMLAASNGNTKERRAFAWQMASVAGPLPQRRRSRNRSSRVAGSR